MQQHFAPQVKGTLEVVSDLETFFRDALASSLKQQHLSIRGHTTDYLVNMLTVFSKTEAFFEPTEEGLGLKTLAEMLGETLQAENDAERNAILQRLGDISLFVAGFLSRGFERRVVDVDYHIAMGGNAYGSLANRQPPSRGALAQVFGELAAKFQPLVDVLNEISDAAYTYSPRDILRLYELWLKTGSRRARNLLRRLGVEAAPVGLQVQ